MNWSVDTAHSSIEFSVKHMMISTVKGNFAKYDIKLDVNTDNPSLSVVEATIDPAAINTGVADRDGHLKSPDFFDVAKFPTIKFKSTKIEAPNGLRSEEFKLIGDLTVRDVTKPVELHVVNEGSAKDMQGNRKWGFTATTTISRKEWGLHWNVALEAGGWLVGDQVKVSVLLEVAETAPATA